MAVDYKEFVLSQYANSPRFMALLNGFVESIGTDVDVDKFYEKIFNILTAEGYGLDIWGKILDISRNITLDDGKIYYLPDNDYRFLLTIRAMSNVSNCTVENLEDIMTNLFQERGVVRLYEIGTMHIKYIFDFHLLPEELAILKLSNVPPKPTGVQIDFIQMPLATTFGFHGTGFQPFGHGNFRTKANSE